MATNREEKKEVRHREWAKQIAECQSSGMKIKEWCLKKGISYNTYYRRLRVVRMDTLDRAEHGIQQIVPLSVAEENYGTASIAAPQIDSNVPCHTVRESEKVVMRKDGIEIELPQNVSENTLLTLLRGLREC